MADTVLKHMKKGGTGEVLMVNSAGIYLSTDDRIWLLCDISWGMVPIGIAIEGFADLIARLGIEPGQTFSFCENTLIFSGRVLYLRPTAPVDFHCDSATPRVDLIRKAAEDIANLRKTRGISMLVIPLVLGDLSRDVVSLNPYCTRAYQQLTRLMQALSDEANEAVRACVDSLLGLGTGLTPSADDVMLGMIYTFRKLGGEAPRSARVLCDSVLDMCDAHTNKVSAAYLKAVVGGAYFERVERVFNGLCENEPLSTSLLLEIGGSSGTEMLLGMLCALGVAGYRIITEK